MLPRKLSLCSAAFALTAFAQAAYSQTPALPDAYTVTQVNSMFGPPVTQTISRSGNKALVETASAAHTMMLYDLAAGTTTSWSAANPTSCGSGKFSGDWGDPFVQSAGIAKDLMKQNPKDLGAATVNGLATKLLELAPGPGNPVSGKVWLEVKTGIIAKLEVSQGGAAARTMLEVKSLDLAPPPASRFAPPAACRPAQR